MKKFITKSKFGGYLAKKDKTNIREDLLYLVSDSKNTLVNDLEKVSVRSGYSLLGASNSATTPIESEYVWKNSSGDEIVLRSYDDELEIYNATLAAWTRLKNSWTYVDFVFATWWDNTEKIDKLLFVGGDTNIYEWSGGIATLSSSTSNTLTKTGTTTWAQERFLTTGTRKVVINGTEYTYTGGETTTALTGVTPDPTSEAAGSTVLQAVRTNSNKPASTFTNDFIAVLNNHIYCGSLKSNLVYMSKSSDFTDFSYSSPRVPGDGYLFTLDSPGIGFAAMEKEMFISGLKDEWYRTEFLEIDINGTLSETAKIKKLRTGAGQGAKEHNLITTDLGGIVYINNNNQLMSMSVESGAEPQPISLSNNIQDDFNTLTFTGGHIKAHKNRIYISAPTNSKVYISELVYDENGQPYRFWQPPQVLPVSFFSVYLQNLYGHSNSNAESYKLFDSTVYSDNEKSYEARAVFAYWNGGDRVNLKNMDEWATDGYISSNTELNFKLNYDYDGFTQSPENTISGRDTNIIFESSGGGSLGDSPLGDEPIGDTIDDTPTLRRFRVINEFSKQDFFEIQPIYSTNERDQRWEIIALGANIKLSKMQPINIKQ